MKESYREDLASNSGLELYADDGNVMGVATTEEVWGHTQTGRYGDTHKLIVARCEAINKEAAATLISNRCDPRRHEQPRR